MTMIDIIEKFGLECNQEKVYNDGPHTLHSQIEAIDLYLPKLNKGCVFIVEDLQEASWFNYLIKESEKYQKVIYPI